MNYDVAADKFAMGATQGVAGGAMGMALGGFNALAQGVADEQAMKDQYFQQLKLNNMSQIFNKDMYNYQMNKQFEMWENTNYSAQVEQLKKAGLNPALLYGKGGGMGATTGSASSGNLQSHAWYFCISRSICFFVSQHQRCINVFIPEPFIINHCVGACRQRVYYDWVFYFGRQSEVVSNTAITQTACAAD